MSADILTTNPMPMDDLNTTQRQCLTSDFCFFCRNKPLTLTDIYSDGMVTQYLNDHLSALTFSYLLTYENLFQQSSFLSKDSPDESIAFQKAQRYIMARSTSNSIDLSALFGLIQCLRPSYQFFLTHALLYRIQNTTYDDPVLSSMISTVVIDAWRIEKMSRIFGDSVLSTVALRDFLTGK